uniref:DZANK-type domain-containing protein n=1 Tax=Mola mola TaxID=94237 RepID=A0A3Q3X7R4_MOLML
MAAGAVLAPLIIPMVHRETHGAKSHIDTNTRVSIQSDTPGVLLFYTLDGSRPAALQRGLAASSRKYREPILLPAGRVAVRAVAAQFEVEDDGKCLSSIWSSFSWPELADQSCPKHALPKFPVSGKGTERNQLHQAHTNRKCVHDDFYFVVFPVCQDPDTPTKANSKQTSRIKRETDFLRCVQCLSFRPSDPFAWFCPHCGVVVPRLLEQTFLPAEGGQVVSCVFCNTHVPVNTHTCFMCEASIHPQLQPQQVHTLHDHVICVVCGSGNPAHISSCLTCESCLYMCVVPSVPSADGRMLSCTRCNRINHHDARFCNWCGSKTGPAANCLLCWQCGASGHPFASYCSACGVFLGTPAPPTNHAPRQGLATSTAEQYTQTVGLYYPSANQLQKKAQQRALQVSRQQATRDRQPLLTAVSPGRGYWRKQLDHVCAHLRSYTQNHAAFRALLGEPRLGQMVSAVVWEDGDEVSLTVSFVSAGRERKQVRSLSEKLPER